MEHLCAWLLYVFGAMGSLRMALLLSCAFTLPALHAQALAPVPVTAVDRIDLSGAIYKLEDPGGTLTIGQLRHPEHASRFVRASPSFGFTSSVIWIRLSLRRDANAPSQWWLDSGNRTLKEIAQYVPDEAGRYQVLATGSAHRFSERPLRTATYVFPLALGDAPVDVYLRIRSGGIHSTTLSPTLWQAVAYQRQAEFEKLNWTAYLGIAGGLCIFNFLLFLSIRDRNFILYVLSLLSIVWSASSGQGGYGAAYEFFWPDQPLFEQVGWLLAFMAGATFPVVFIMQFVGMYRALPRLSLSVVGLQAVLLVLVLYETAVIVQDLQVDPDLLHFIHLLGVSLFMPVVPMVIGGLVVLLWRGNRQAKFISVAFLPVMVLAAMIGHHMFTGRPAPLYLLMWTSAFELVVMSLALADRVNQEKKARVLVQEKLVDVLRQSERSLEEKVAVRTEELRSEQSRSRELLHNIFPAELADELTATGRTRTVRHENASILFTDFCGFTEVVSTMPADRIVAELNEMFAAFDDITDRCGVEKIKTIGDSYMASAGLPKPCDDHALRCVSAGLAMLAYVEQRNCTSAFKWALRIGIHSGPVVAGVVGKRKYAFDIWGDSVNLASRMESAGGIGKVNVSAYTYDLIRNAFECEYRGKLAAKGKGEIDMYFVLSERSVAALPG